MTLLGVIVFYAISSKSSRILKLAAIIALGLICLAVFICGIILIIGPKETEPVYYNPYSPGTQSQQGESGIRIGEIIFLAIIFIAIGLIIAKASRDQRKLSAAKAKMAPTRSPSFKEANELDDLEHQGAPEKADDDDDGFNLDI